MGPNEQVTPAMRRNPKLWQTITLPDGKRVRMLVTSKCPPGEVFMVDHDVLQRQIDRDNEDYTLRMLRTVFVPAMVAAATNTTELMEIFDMEAGEKCPQCGCVGYVVFTGTPFPYRCSDKDACGVRFTRHGDLKPGDRPAGQQ